MHISRSPEAKSFIRLKKVAVAAVHSICALVDEPPISRSSPLIGWRRHDWPRYKPGPLNGAVDARPAIEGWVDCRVMSLNWDPYDQSQHMHNTSKVQPLIVPQFQFSGWNKNLHRVELAPQSFSIVNKLVIYISTVFPTIFG
jgi:hypothetical protein